MDLDEFLGPNPIIVNLRAENRWEAIDELLDHLVANGRIKIENKAAIEDDIKKRESSMSTGIGFGIAIPHASTNLVSEVVGIMGRSRQGIQFDSLDKKLVKRVLMFLVPQGQFRKYLPVFADIAKIVHRIPPDERE